jgi:hypothetical protein
MNRRYRIPAGTDVLVLRHSDPPDCWQPHVTRIDLAFDKPVRFAEPCGTLSGRLVFRRGDFLIAVPRGGFEAKPARVPSRKPSKLQEPTWHSHAIKWGELELVWLMPREADAMHGL